MNEQIRQAMEQRLAELEPKQAELWNEYQRLQAKFTEIAKPTESARTQWASVYSKIEWLKAQLAKAQEAK